MRGFGFIFLWIAALLLFTMLWGCGSSSSSSPSPGPAKATISGTVTFPTLNNLVAKQVSLAAAPTLEVRNLNGSVVATALVTGSGTSADPYRYSVTGIDSSSDYIIKAASGTQVMKALVNKDSLLPETTRNIDTIATTAVFLAEKKLNIAPGTIGETQNSVTSSAIGDLQPAVLENRITAAVNTVLYAPAAATQANVDLTNLVNIVTATVYSGVNTARFLSGAETTPLSTTQYTLATGGGASSGASTSVATVTAQSTLTDTAGGYTPPAANSVSDIAKVYDYNTSSAGTPLSGVTAVTVGLSPVIATTTDVNGMFVLAGIPQETSFYVKMSKAGYADAYSNTFSLTAHNDVSDRPYALWLPSKLTDWGNLTGNGVIRSRVVTSTNQVSGYIGGAVVSATDQADNTTYPVKYIDSATGLISGTLTGTDPANGWYIVLNVPDGRTINVTAAKTGYTFNTRTFTVHADAVSESRIVGTAAATPAANKVKSILQSGLYNSNSDSYQSGTTSVKVYAVQHIGLAADGTSLTETNSYYNSATNSWAATLPPGAPINLFSRLKYYLTSSGWVSGTDKPQSFNLNFNSDDTATLTNKTDGSNVIMTITSTDVSGQNSNSVGSGHQLPWQLQASAGSFPTGSTLYDMTITNQNDSYFLRPNDSSVPSIMTSLGQIPGSQLSAEIDSLDNLHYFAQFVAGESSVNIYQQTNGQTPLLIGSGSWALGTVSGQQILEISIPASLRTQYQLGGNPIYGIVSGKIYPGIHSAPGVGYTNGGTGWNSVAIQLLQSSILSSLSTGSVTAQW